MLIQVMTERSEIDGGVTVMLPTWSMIGSPDHSGLVVVDVPDRDMPVSDDGWERISVERVGALDVVTHIPDSVLTGWLRFLSERYDQNERMFKPFG